MKAKETIYGPTVWAMSLVMRHAPKLAVAYILLMVAGAVLPVATLWAIGNVVDVTLAGVDADASIAYTVGPWLAIFGIMIFMTSACSLATENIATRLSAQVRAAVGQMLCEHSTRIEMDEVLSPTLQTSAFRASAGMTDRPATMFYTSMSLGQSALSLICLSGCLVGAGWWLPLAVLMAGAPMLITRLAATRRTHETHTSLADKDRVNAYCNKVLTQPEYKPEVKIFGLARHFAPLFAAGLKETTDSRLDTQASNTTWQMVGLLASSAMMVAVFFAAIIVVISGGDSIGSLAMYLMAIRRADTAARDVALRLSNLSRQSLMTEAMREYFASAESAPDRTEAFPQDFKEISLEGVSYAYPGSRRKALTDASLRLRRGETTAIVGGNGSGKSTIGMLISGLLRPSVGHVRIGETEACAINMTDIERHVSVLFQDFRVYRATVRDNLLFGDPTRSATECELRHATQMVGLDTLIDKLPDGYDTLLGPSFPGSEMFSRGEWQRLALARVILSPAEIVILDEPNSAMDSDAQRLLANVITEMKRQGRTVIMIAHTQGIIDLADNVISVAQDQ